MLCKGKKQSLPTAKCCILFIYQHTTYSTSVLNYLFVSRLYITYKNVHTVVRFSYYLTDTHVVYHFRSLFRDSGWSTVICTVCVMEDFPYCSTLQRDKGTWSTCAKYKTTQDQFISLIARCLKSEIILSFPACKWGPFHNYILMCIIPETI